MAQTVQKLDPRGALWRKMREDAQKLAAEEPILASFMNATVLLHDSFASALSYRLAQKLGSENLDAMRVRSICQTAYDAEPEIPETGLIDLRAFFERDPACRTTVQPFLYFKGYHALQAHRVANWLWREGRTALAFHLQSRMSERFAVDIHPAAPIGRGVFLDHATGVVIGETAAIGDNVSILHGVTLGGTGKEAEDRHPKVRDGVLIGAGAEVLGNIVIGENARIAAGSVVVKPVPPNTTVAGVPAKPVGGASKEPPSQSMEQRFEDKFDDGGGI